jgi:hypothetical protein
LQAVLTAY